MGIPLRALIVEDSEDDALLLVRELQRGGYDVTFERVETAGAMTEALDNRQLDIVLADYTMPHFSGTDALTLLREKGFDIPFIFVSGTIGEDKAVAAMKSGAHDYIIKGNLKRLIPAIERELREAVVRRERRKAEAALRESEERYRALAEAARDVIFIIKPDGYIQYINSFGASQQGCQIEEIIGKSINDLFPPYIVEQQKQKIREVFETGKDVYHELNIPFPEHEQLGEAHLTPLKDAAGNVHAILGIVRDITERKRAEEALKESEERFRLLTESTLTGVYLIQDNLFRYVNPALASIFGYKGEELIDKLGPMDLVEPEDRDLVAGNIRKRIEGGVRDIRYSFKGLRKDGTIIDVEVHGARVEYNGKPAVIGTLLDITERKRAEEVRVFLANITEHATDAIEGMDLNTNIVSWNRGAEMLFGYSAQEIIGRPHSLIIPKEAQEACRERFKKATLEGSVRAETERIKKDGRRFPVEMTLTALKDDRGEHTGFVCITRDITERKKLEEQLRQAQKMEAIGQLAGGIAHDFNNILNAIIGFGNLIEMNTKEDDPNRAYLKEILDAGERGSHLTQSLLAFSRKQIIDPKAQNLNEIIKGVEKFLMRIIGEDIELKTILNPPTPQSPLFPPLVKGEIEGLKSDVPPFFKGGQGGIGDLTVFVDRGQIEQVLMNLATNARDAMPEGGDLILETGTIQIEEEYVKRHGYGEAGIYALLSVTDSGIGMDEKTRERIFEPFFTTKELGRGTGLGLSMVYGIIKQHDGFINVYSEPQKGTTFKIYLPLIESEVEETASIMPAGYPEGGTETVLIAEDDQAVRKLTRDILERFGYRVIAAEDGEDAIEKFMKNKEDIQLLLLDVIMPKKNGKEVYEEIKKINPGIKTIFLSGYTANLIHKKGILEEGLDFILKPVSPKELLGKVREMLDSPHPSSPYQGEE